MISPLLYPPAPPAEADIKDERHGSTATDFKLASSDGTGNKSESVGALMKYLDFLRPFLLKDNALVTAAVARFEFLQSRVIPPNPPLNLLTFEVCAQEEIYDFFPGARSPNFDILIQRLSFENTILGKRVLLLDMLTFLIIVFRGSLESKTEYLFKWYNVNGTGLMTEVEHISFILRVGKIMTKVKILSTIDLTEDDARHIAFTSRIKQEVHKRERREAKVVSVQDFLALKRAREEAPAGGAQLDEHKALDQGAYPHQDTQDEAKDDSLIDGGLTINPKMGKIGFYPGLTIVEFNRWARYSREGRAISDFVVCLDRLADTLRVLDARTDAMVDIVLEKEEFRKQGPSVPRPDILTLHKVYDSPVHVISRAQNSITAIVVAQHLVEDPNTEVFIKIEKLQMVSNPLYPIPPMTVKRIQDSGAQQGHDAEPLCCDRVYTLVTYVQNTSVAHSRAVSKGDLMQVHVEGLDPNANYQLTIYTKMVYSSTFDA